MKRIYHRTLVEQNEADEKKVKEIIEFGWSADFETTALVNYTRERCVRVYAFELLALKSEEKYIGLTIEEFHEIITSDPKFKYIFFHNLRFDFSFYESYLQGDLFYIYTLEKNVRKIFRHSYTTVRNTMNALYSATVSYEFQQHTYFYDLAKLFPQKLADIGEAIGIPKLVGDLDYDKYRPIGELLTEKEAKYLHHDVLIVKTALLKFFEKYKCFKMTRSSVAYDRMQKTWAIDKYGSVEDVPKYWKRDWQKLFPSEPVELWKELHDAYFGGYVFVNEGIIEMKITQIGNTVDANSEYPGAMQQCDFPCGVPVKFEGNYNTITEFTTLDYMYGHKEIPGYVKELDVKKVTPNFYKKYPLYFQKFKAKFTLKEKHIPCLAKKLSYFNKVIKSEKDLRNKEIILTNVDFKHFLINYDVHEIEYLGGYAYKSIAHPMKPFIDLCAKEKIQADIDGNKILRLMAKLDMNGCYGKEAQNIKQDSKATEVVDGVLKFKNIEAPEQEMNNIAMACFITSWGRNTLLEAAYLVDYDKLCYMDTDSIHLIGDIPEALQEIMDPYELGKWKHESTWTEAKFLRDKCYVEKIDGKLDIKCAGLSDKAKESIKSIDDFQLDKEYPGTLMQRQVKGGVLLIEQTKFLASGRELTDKSKEFLSKMKLD